MSFLIEESEEEFSVVSSRLGCSENIVDSADLNSQAMKGEDLDMCNLQIDKLHTEKSQSSELKLELGSEINIACSSEASTLNQAAQLQGPSSNTMRKTESAPLTLLKLHIFPSHKIVNRLSEIKKKNIRGPSKRLTQKTPKT